MKDLKRSDVGKKFTANIEGVRVEGKVQFENDKFYLCQDRKDGDNCSNKLGYRLSWTVGSGTISALETHNVTDLEMRNFTAKEIEEYKDFQVGDTLIRPGIYYDRKVVHKFEEFLLTADSDDGKATLMTAEDLYENGWRLQMEAEEEKEEVVEMSVAEVAKKLGISVESLKIVDK